LVAGLTMMAGVLLNGHRYADGEDTIHVVPDSRRLRALSA
jgi:hypothetical protein